MSASSSGARPPCRIPLIAGIAAALALVAGCAVSQSEPPPRDVTEVRFRTALEAFAREDVGRAVGELQALAGDCHAGRWGRKATLAWSFLELDPRYGEGSPETAARLAARYLQMPNGVPGLVRLAETLYLLALDLGAEPVENPLQPPEEELPVASRFDGCDAEGEPAVVPDLPTHPGPATTWTSLMAVTAERDSLAAQVDALTRRNDSLEAMLQSLEGDLASLERELQRIRGLMLPDFVPARDSLEGR